jgi:hypothetical protein
VAKTVLGRGLGHLMNGAKPANAPETPSLPFSEPGDGASGSAVGPGLSKLLHGQRHEAAAASQPAPAAPSTPEAGGPPTGSLRWALVAADLLLVALAVGLVAGRRGRLGVWEGLLCILAFGLGAWLGCRAFLMFRRRP